MPYEGVYNTDVISWHENEMELNNLISACMSYYTCLLSYWLTRVIIKPILLSVYC